MQVPGSSSSWEEEEVLYLPLLNCSQLMESELTGSLHVVLEWLNCKHQIPISTTPRPGASGMLWVVSFLRAMPHLMGCWMAATAACSHEEDAWRSAIYFHFSSPPHYCVFLASHLYSHWQSECWGVLLGQGSPCSGQGGGRPGWCPRALAGLCAPASLPCSWGDTATPCSWAPTAAHIAQHRGAQRRQQGNPLPVLHLHGLAGMGQLVPLPTGACPSAVVLRGYAVPLSF